MASMKTKSRKTVLVSLYSELQQCIYYKCFVVDTAVANGSHHVKGNIVVYVVNQDNDYTALRQLKADQKANNGCQRIYPSDTNLIDWECKDLIADFDGTLQRRSPR